MSKNGAVILRRELRLRVTPEHQRSLEGLANLHGWNSPMALAESLLARAIEQAARHTAQSRFLALVIAQFQRSRVA